MKRAAWILALVAGMGHAETGVSLVFERVPLIDLARIVYSDLAAVPVIFAHDAKGDEAVTIIMRKVAKEAAVRQIADLLEKAGYGVEDRAGVVWISRAREAGEEIIVYRPIYRPARYLADVVQTVTGARSLLSRSIRTQESMSLQQEQKPPNRPEQIQARPQESVTSAAGQIDRSEVDQVAFSVAAKDARKVKKLLADLDTPSGEVVLKAAVYEVGSTKQEGGAVKLALSLAGIKAGLGKTIDGGASIKLSGGGLDAILSVLDADSRFRSVSRPHVRVKNGATARFSVGQDVPVLGTAQMDKAGNPVQSVDYKQSGIILTATPEIREGAIELNLSQELSSFVVTSTGVNNSPTLIKRAVNTRLSVSPGEAIVLAGLQDERQDDQTSRLPWLSWLLSKEQSRQQSEILVLIEAERL
jgi:type II secretory pathway component GspD/PulD (secretin)